MPRLFAGDEDGESQSGGSTLQRLSYLTAEG